MEFLLVLFYFIFWNTKVKRSGQCNVRSDRSLVLRLVSHLWWSENSQVVPVRRRLIRSVRSALSSQRNGARKKERGKKGNGEKAMRRRREGKRGEVVVCVVAGCV